MYGIGEAKLREFGEPVLALIKAHCAAHGLPTNVVAPLPPPAPPKPRAMTPALTLAFSLFRTGTLVEDVMHQMKRTRATVFDYLCEFIRAEKPASVHCWIERTSYDVIAQAARAVGTERLKPIFIKLGEKYDYDAIRVVVTHLTMNTRTSQP